MVTIDKAMERFNLLRGIMALWIVVGHCSAEFEHEIFPFMLVHRFNLVIVGMFFLLSEYGLAFSFHNKNNYLKGFLKKKTLTIFSMTFTVYLFSLILYAICNMGKVDSLESFVFGYFTKTNWYMFELLYFYVLFWIVFQLNVSNRLKLILCFGGTFLILLIVPFTSLGLSYCISSMSFPFGILVFMYQEKLNSIILKHRMVMLLTSIIVCGLSCLSILLPNKSFIAICGKNLMCISTCCLMITLLSFKSLDIQRGKGLSNISPYIYLYHIPIYLSVKNCFIENNIELNLAYIVICCVLAIVVSGIVYGIHQILIHMHQKFIKTT